MKKSLYIRTCHKALKLVLLLMPYFFYATSTAGSLSQKAGYETYIRTDTVVNKISSALSERNHFILNSNSNSLTGPTYTTFDYLLNRNSALNFVSYFARLAPPTISCPGNIVSVTDPGVCKATKDGLAATINDPDGDITTLTWTMNGATMAASPLTGINNILTSFDFNRGTTTVTYKVTDASASSASCSFTVTVSDTEKPVIVCPADANISIPSCAILTDTIMFSALAVSDNCGILNFSSNAPLQFPMGSTLVLWTANDINGNSSQCTQTVTVTNDPPVQLTIINQTNVTCSGSATGSVTVEGNGGTLPYQYSINGGAFQASGIFNSLIAGTYNIIVKDASNCTSSLSVIITQPATILVASITSQTNVLCSGQSTGSATASASGGTPPYTYSWNTSPVQTTATATNLTARAYTVTVTDASGCNKTASVTITQPTPITIAVTTTNVACFGDSSGTAIALASGGTPPYTYAWLTVPIQSTASIINLPADKYTLAVFDSQGCFKPAFITISQPDSEFTASITNQVNVLCAGSNTGSLTATGVGGVPPYQYSLNGGAFQASGIFNSLSAGVYAIVARDANNCTVNLSATITAPADPLTALITGQTNVLCAGQSNGSATVTASGGTSPYTYSWNTSPVQTTATATNLTARAYTVTVTDASGCNKTASVTITQPTPITIAVTTTNVACFGDSSGTATALASGGTPPYTYAWITVPIQSTASVINLPADKYTLAVFDSQGCFKPAFVTISEPDTKLTASISAQSNILCAGQANGSATVTASGGTAPYTYSWNTIPVQTTTTATNLLTGTYVVTTTDNNGCTDTDTVIITEPASALTGLITSQVNYDCLSGTNGSVTVAGAGGTPGYQFSLNGGAFQPIGTFSNLAVGNYIVTVQDANNCEVTVPVEIIVFGLVLAENDTITTSEDTPVNGNVMTNDQLLCNLPIIVTSNTAPLHGSATVNSDGSFTYTPSLNYNGPDSFTYTLTDNVGGTSTATVFVQIDPVNDPPVLFSDSLTVNYNLPKTGNVLLNGDYDPDSTALTVNTTPILDAVNGTFVIAADGSFTYTPFLNYIGTDIVVINICDMGIPLPALCGNDTIFITVLPPNQPPLTINETLIVCNDAPFIGTLSNGGSVFNGETDPENNLPITVRNTLVQSPAHGVFLITDTVSGTFNYTPAGAYNGPDYAVVSICDSGIPVECSNDTVYFEVYAPINANAGTSQILCNSDVASLVGNSPEPGTGSWAFVSGPNIPTVYPSTGNVAIASGMISSPIPYVFSYSVSIGSCVSADTMSVINFIPATPAYAGNDQLFCSINANITTTLAASTPVNGTGIWTQLAGPSTATILDTTNPNTDISNLTFGEYTFQWSVSNGICPANADVVTILISQPVMVNAGIDQTIYPGATTSLTGSASGGSGFYAWSWQPAGLLVNPAVENPVTLALNSETSFILTVMDLTSGCTNSDTVRILINGAGNLVAVADYDTTLINSPVTIQVLANDLNTDSVQLSVSICGFPAHGIVSVNSDNTITYSPYSDYEGEDEFCYKICDEAQPLLCADNMVYIHVKQPSLNDLYAYNGISPNSDGFNDVWKIRGIEKYPDNTVLIFNRWGDKLREFAGYNNSSRSWDGKNEKGQVVPDGTYFYILDVKNVGVLKGWIYLRGQK